MSWKDQLRVEDIEAGDRLELTCRRCGHLRYLIGAELHARRGIERLRLSEVEARARCRQRGCDGAMRLAMPDQGETVGFVGGIA